LDFETLLKHAKEMLERKANDGNKKKYGLLVFLLNHEKQTVESVVLDMSLRDAASSFETWAKTVIIQEVLPEPPKGYIA